MNIAWLVATPIAHRGLHSKSDGIVENTLSAAARAAARGFTIECDVQGTKDGEVVVFHDSSLERLTPAHGPVCEMTAAALGAIPLRDTGDHIPTLGAFLATCAGAVPVIVEIKSRFDGDFRLADRAANIVGQAKGPIALKSFDPDVIAYLRDHPALAGRDVPRGIVAEAEYTDSAWSLLSSERKLMLAQFLHFDTSRPDFLSYRAKDCPHAVPYLYRTGLGLPVMAWTVRSQEEAQHALRWADQIIFESYDPAER